MTAATGWWVCAECGEPMDDPHTDDEDRDVCAGCCEPCRSGAIRAWQEQVVKERATAMNPGDPIIGHGIATTSQMAAAEGWRPEGREAAA